MQIPKTNEKSVDLSERLQQQSEQFQSKGFNSKLLDQENSNLNKNLNPAKSIQGISTQRF